MKILPGLVFRSIVGASLALGLESCATDDAGRRALTESTTLRAQVDQVREREDSNTREIARIQSQIRALESDIAATTGEMRAASVELARARVLLEEARNALRERQDAAAAAAPAPAPPATPLAVAPPPAPATPSPPPMPIAPLPEPAKPAPPTVASRPPSVAPAEKPAATAKAKPASPPSPGREPAVARPPAPTPEGAKPSSRAGAAPEQLFSTSMANFRAQEHGQAVLELTDLIARYPDHTLAPAAQLWIGQAYYQQRDYRQSLVELKRVMEAYSKSPQVADALLKSGLCHRALGDRSSATALWEQVVRDHPSSAAAGQARMLLGTRQSAAGGSR
jgi:tol-pal system protein YbgF